MCFALVISAGFPRSLVKIRQVLFRQTSQITRVLNLNCSADLSKRRVIKVSKPLFTDLTNDRRYETLKLLCFFAPLLLMFFW